MAEFSNVLDQAVLTILQTKLAERDLDTLNCTE